MSRLRLVRSPSGPRIRVVGHRRRGLVLVRGEQDVTRWRAEREVRSWRRHFGTVRLDASAVVEVLAEHGLRLCEPGEWPKAVAVAEGEG